MKLEKMDDIKQRKADQNKAFMDLMTASATLGKTVGQDTVDLCASRVTETVTAHLLQDETTQGYIKDVDDLLHERVTIHECEFIMKIATHFHGLKDIETATGLEGTAIPVEKAK